MIRIVLAALLALASTAAIAQPAQTFGPVRSTGITVGPPSSGSAPGQVKLVPSGATSFLPARGPVNGPQPDGIFITPDGPYVDYCSIGGCLDGPHLRSHMQINTTTKAGPDAQENALAINFSSGTGAYGRWSANTAFTAGQVVKVFGSHCTATQNGNSLAQDDCIYQVVTGGTTGSSAPTGNPTSYQDGSVTWKFFSAGINDGKTALNIACNAETGSGQIWCTNFNFSVRYKGGGTAWGEEKDCNNGNEDSSAGTRFLMACTFYGGGGAGTYPFLAHQFVGSGAVNSGSANPYGAHAFIHIAGEPSDVGSVIKDNVILDGGNSDTTIRALGGRRHAVAFLLDESNSNFVLRATGSHAGGGVDLSGAAFPTGTSLKVPNTTFLEWSGSGYLGRNDSAGALTYGGSTDSTTYRFAAFDNGDMSYARHLWSRGAAPALSCPGGSLLAGATDDHGVIVLGTGATGCNFTFAAPRQNKPACSFWMTSGQVPSGSTSTAGVVLNFTAAPAATEIQYHCMGR